MPKFRPILVFALWFIVIYGLLIAPWPGARGIYAGYFRTLGRAIFVENGSRRILRFQPINDHDSAWPPNFDTSIIMANRDLLDHESRGRTFTLAVDAWQMGWVPTAFFLSLTLATPIPWRRRLWAVFWGLLWIHVFILLTLGIFIWNESTRLSLVTLTPFWKEMADRLEELALAPVGPSFFAAALIWILVTFRRQDLAGKL